MKKISVLLAVFALLVITTRAKADQFDLNYTGTGSGTTLDGGDGVTSNPISFSGIIDTGIYSSNIGGTSIGGWEVTGISGERDGVAISGLVTDGNFPNAIVINDAQFDNGLLQSGPTFGFDNNGLSFTTTDGNEYNLFSVNQTAFTGGGYLEAPNGNFDYQPVGVSISQVSEQSSTIMLFGAGLLGLAFVSTKRGSDDKPMVAA